MRVRIRGLDFRRLPERCGEAGVQKRRAGQAADAGGASKRFARVSGCCAGGLVMRAFVAHPLARVFRRIGGQQHKLRPARPHGFDRQVGADGQLSGLSRQTDEA